MASKQEILGKIKIMISTKFDDPKAAFDYFDGNKDGALNKKELKKMLKASKVSGLLRSIVAKKIIEGLDKNKGKKVEWTEFETIVNDLMKSKKAKKEKKTK